MTLYQLWKTSYMYVYETNRLEVVNYILSLFQSSQGSFDFQDDVLIV